jgi:hypothetical protein
VEWLLSRVSPKTDPINSAVRVSTLSAWSIHRFDLQASGYFFSDSLTKTFHYFKIIFLGHCFALWKKFMVNNALKIKKTVSMTLTFDDTCLTFFGHGDPFDD